MNDIGKADCGIVRVETELGRYRRTRRLKKRLWPLGAGKGRERAQKGIQGIKTVRFVQRSAQIDEAVRGGHAEYPGGREIEDRQREAQRLVIHEPAAGDFNLVILVWTGVKRVATARVLQGVRFPRSC